MIRMMSAFAAVLMLTLGMAAFQPSHAATASLPHVQYSSTYDAEAGAGGR